MPNAKLRCKHCRDYFNRETMVKFPSGRFCSKSHAADWAIANQSKGKTKIAKADRNKDLIRKKVFRGSDTRWQHTQTQKAFNKLRRLQEIKWFMDRGLEPECISCGKTNMDWCNGHFKTVGSQGALRYDPINSYLQCNKYCNQSLSGNLNGTKTTRGYMKGLEDRFGKNKALEIINYCALDRIKAWSGEELVEMRKAINKEIRMLQLTVTP